MNVKKIIKGIVGLGAMAGVAYAAYKFGESNGKINERFREKYGDDEDDIELDDNEDEFRFYDNYDEPDDACLAPKTENKPSFSVSIHKFAPLDSVKVEGISEKDMDMLVYHISLDKYTSNKQIREWLVLRVRYPESLPMAIMRLQSRLLLNIVIYLAGIITL